MTSDWTIMTECTAPSGGRAEQVDSNKEVELKPPCGRCVSLNKVCTELLNHMCNLCQKLKGKCNKSSRCRGKGGAGEEKGKAPGMWLAD